MARASSAAAEAPSSPSGQVGPVHEREDQIEHRPKGPERPDRGIELVQRLLRAPVKRRDAGPKQVSGRIDAWTVDRTLLGESQRLAGPHRGRAGPAILASR